MPDIPGHALIALFAAPGAEVSQEALNAAREAVASKMKVRVPPSR